MVELLAAGWSVSHLCIAGQIQESRLVCLLQCGIAEEEDLISAIGTHDEPDDSIKGEELCVAYAAEGGLEGSQAVLAPPKRYPL